MAAYKLIVKNAKVILKTVTNAVLNISGIKDLLTGTGSVDSNNKINWTLQEYTNTAANFTSINPVLLLGQKGIETDGLLTTPKFKIGDGITAWNILPYANSGSSSGVQSVTGNSVDNTDPLNPIVNVPTLQEVVTENPTVNGLIAQSPDGFTFFNIDDTGISFTTNGSLFQKDGDVIATVNDIPSLAGYELLSNKQTDLTASATKYPTIDAVNTGLSTISAGNKLYLFNNFT